MTTSDIMLRVAEALSRAKIPSMIVGSFSSNYHGIPRSTQDVDFVLQLDSALTSDFVQILGDEFEAEPQLTFETNTGTQKQEFRVKGTEFKVELFRLSNDPFDQERFSRRQPVNVAGCQVWFPTAEDVIVMKLRWARAKDKADVRDVMFVKRGKLDWPYIENWCRKHGTLAKLDEIRRTIADI
jgi:predicted nucleotidyltransferase